MRIPEITLIHAVAFAALALNVCAAPKWKNPSERYANAHKKYVGAASPIPEDGIRRFVYFDR